MSVFIHVIELIRTVAPREILRTIQAVVVKFILEVIKVCVSIRVNVSYIEGFLVHGHLLYPLPSVFAAYLSLFIHHNLILHGVKVGGHYARFNIFIVEVAGEVPAHKDKQARHDQ